MNDPSYVKILIKAPNQLVDDQTVLCERNWTVRQLKNHLARVYPCKPQPEKQKLIYSGQLLSDEAVLSDVLRSYDGLENNTIHLVCSARDSYKMNNQAPRTGPQPQQPQPSTSRHDSNTIRNNADDLARLQNSNIRPTGPFVFPPMVNGPLTMAQQNLMFQQAYFNYMANFSQMYLMANRIGVLDTPESYSQTVVNNQENQNVNPDVPVHDRVEEEADEGRDEARANRDWLEWFYIFSRLFILCTVVYFYSSPERFIMVIAMALILINIDVFRWLRGNNAAEAQPPPPPTANVNPAVILENRAVDQHNWFNITWTFMKTFFLSLVPDNREI